VWGDVDLKGHVDLAKVARYIPDGALPVSTMRGAIDIAGRLERDSASDFTPLVELRAKTTGLSVSGPGNAGVPATPSVPANASVPAIVSSRTPRPRWTVEGVDAEGSVQINGSTGFLELNARVHDARGDLVVLAARSAGVPYAAIYNSPSGSLALLPDMPFDARITVPQRDLLTLPPSLGHPPVDGELQANLTVKGPLTSPTVSLTGTLAKVTAGLTRLTTPLDFDVRSTYEGGRGEVELRAVRGLREVLKADVFGTVSAADLVARRVDLPWEASAKAHVDDLPLVTFGPLDDRQIRGRLSGDFALDRLHVDAKANASFVVHDLKVGEAVYPTATASLVADGKTLAAEARVEQVDGYATARAAVPATWGTSLSPKPDPKHALDLTVAAKHFRAAVLLPFVQGSIDELDGVVDADVQATLDPTTQKLELKGSASLDNGLFELATFGGEFHDITAKVKLAGGLLTLESFKASGISGEVLASASARLDGLRLQAASATLQIPKSRPLPLSVNGSQLGTVDGRLNVTESMSADKGTLDVKVDIPTLHFTVPEKGSQDVQTLGRLEGVTLGKRLGPDRTFVADPVATEDDDEVAHGRSADARTIRITTELRDDVSLRRGTDLRVQLTGAPVVTITDKVVVSGRIQLRGGSLNLYGKSFEIETGTVTFVGEDSSNPQVAVTAGWSAPDGSQIKADFIGPLKTGKVTLRSEPPLSQNDIVQLLLFGTVDGQAAAAKPGQAPGQSSAEGVAGAVATQPLNRALDQFGLSAVSTKVDTSSMVAKPEVQVQIAKDVSVQLATLVGLPPPGDNPDRTFVTVDWRFLRKWSLEGTVGNATTTIVDLIWQYRY
jgi:translocation and assembly module TamB